MKAPSEKHLEDWIVANRELFEPQEELHFPYLERIIARQPRLPSGIADLIGVNCDQVVVVELKRDLIDEKVIGQTLRYMANLKRMWNHAWQIGLKRDGSEQYTYCFRQPLSLVHGLRGEVGGLIVGHRIEKQSVIDAAAGAGIDVVTYDYVDDSYVFYDWSGSHSEAFNQAIFDFAYGAIGEAMRDVMRLRSQFEDERRGEPYDFEKRR